MTEEKKLTEEEKQVLLEDFKKRIEAFNAELIPLLKKYKIGIGASAFLLPDGRVGAQVQFFSDTKEKVEDKKAIEA